MDVQLCICEKIELFAVFMKMRRNLWVLQYMVMNLSGSSEPFLTKIMFLRYIPVAQLQAIVCIRGTLTYEKTILIFLFFFVLDSSRLVSSTSRGLQTYTLRIICFLNFIVVFSELLLQYVVQHVVQYTFLKTKRTDYYYDHRPVKTGTM